MSDYRELLIGCGSRRERLFGVPGATTGWRNLTTLDYNPAHTPDVVWNLMSLPLPFESDTFDEIHAYEVLEHTGAQGDYVWFFRQWSEFWRILKPGGYFAATVPHKDSVWAWGDPSHTRVVQKEHLIFLSQQFYKDDVGVTAASDFRHIYKADFRITLVQEQKDTLAFMLKAVKPSEVQGEHRAVHVKGGA